MRIAILSRSKRIYSTKRLVEAAVQLGHNVKVYDTLKMSIHLDKNEPNLFYNKRGFAYPDIVIPRIGASVTFYGLAIIRQFQQMGVYTNCDSVALSRSRDKLHALQMLSNHNIGMPRTEFVKDENDVVPAIKRVGGPPVIIKVLEGTQGRGVILAESTKIAEAVVQSLHLAKQNVLIQKFIKEANGEDIRAFVVGGRVVASMKRKAVEGEFRSNVHLGAEVERVELTEDSIKTAIDSARILGLRVAGVDMLYSEKYGPQVIEVNASPGLEGIEMITETDVAREIIQDAVDDHRRMSDAGIFSAKKRKRLKKYN